MSRKVLVTGGAGYVGAMLVPKLLGRGDAVTVLDTYYFGHDPLASLHGAAGLREVEGDLRDRDAIRRALEGCDTVIHLACISNDPSFELDPLLAKSINFDAFEPLVEESKRAGVRRFVFVSSSSVYGVSEAERVTEEHPLRPLTDYSKYKALCEPVALAAQSPDFTVIVLRPATVCGFSTRMRFDLSVNILTNHAVNKRKITVFGGTQTRPNIHIEDVTDLYVDILDEPAAKVAGEIFNVGYQNHTLARLAEIVKSVVEHELPDLAPIAIETTPTNDNRSYRVESEKIARVLGFQPRRTIEDAVRDLCRAFRNGRFPYAIDDERYYNVQLMKGAKARTNGSALAASG
ncbi:MAG TPA: NAD-dependent epimerase/dehydratase family protein [Candidatus Baltobacteraceae bacterium]|jgi:nucleoside-diphosphate-sugar epimerase